MRIKKKSLNAGFFEDVYDITRMIPYGRVTSYGAIARYLGTGLSARMVGWALNASRMSTDLIPAHRVVNHKGILTGKHYFGSPDQMQKLLENEGLIVKNDCIMNFKERFWDPLTEIT
jgi:methylated-DNA-protein-cysteine methyltransferase-like protein